MTDPDRSMPHDFYPKPFQSEGPEDLYAQGIVKTQFGHRRHGLDEKPEILEATPFLLVSSEHLCSIAWGHWGERWVDLIPSNPLTDDSPWQLPPHVWLGWTLRITGSNRELIYKVIKKRERINAYELAWPD